MSSKYPFSIIKFDSANSRAERVNVGIVVFKNIVADIRIEPSYSRQVLIKEYGFDQELKHLSDVLSHVAKIGYSDGDWLAAFDQLSSGSKWTLSALGQIEAHGSEDYERQVKEILSELVLPPAKKTMGSGKRRLISEFREQLENLNLVEVSDDAFDQGFVTPRYPVKVGNSILRVDFAVKGKDLNLIQTVELSGTDGPDQIRETSYKALVVHRARRVLRVKTNSIFVVRFAHRMSEAQETCKEIISEYGNTIVDFENARQRVELLAYLSNIKSRNEDLFDNRKTSNILQFARSG